MNSKAEEVGEEVEKRRGANEEAGSLEVSSGFLPETRELENLAEFRSTLEITEAIFLAVSFVVEANLNCKTKIKPMKTQSDTSPQVEFFNS